MLLVGNKVDLAEEMSLQKWDAYIKQQLTGLAFCPVSFISALDNLNVAETFEVLFDLREQSRSRIPTARLNEALQEAKEKLRPKSKSIMPKLFYGTQIGTEPLSIVIFVNEPRLFRGQYERYLQSFLQTAFKVEEVPIKLTFKRRGKVQLDPL